MTDTAPGKTADAQLDELIRRTGEETLEAIKARLVDATVTSALELATTAPKIRAATVVYIDDELVAQTAISASALTTRPEELARALVAELARQSTGKLHAHQSQRLRAQRRPAPGADRAPDTAAG